MTKPLTRIEYTTYHYVDGVKVDGAHDRLHGDVKGVHGDVTGLRGDVDEIPDGARPCDISDWVEE
jgi:hypothetical protein